MQQLNYMWLIALKDFKIFIKDRAAVFFFIIFPFMFILMFYFLNLGAATDERLTYHLVTREAAGGLSHQIIGAMETKDESQLEPGAPIPVADDNAATTTRRSDRRRHPGRTTTDHGHIDLCRRVGHRADHRIRMSLSRP